MNRTINSIFYWSSSPHLLNGYICVFELLFIVLPTQTADQPFTKCPLLHSYMIIWCVFQLFYSIVTNIKLLVLYCSVIHFILTLNALTDIYFIVPSTWAIRNLSHCSACNK